MESTKVIFGSNAVTLSPNTKRIGDKAPDFSSINTSLKPIKLSDFSGKVKLISVFPSIDTGICSIQNRRFNSEAAGFGEKVAFLAISTDLPFALKRFCGAENIENLTTLSDHRETDFGLKYGLLINELRLLARAVLVIDANDVIKYIEIVPEIASEPNYEKAIVALNELL